jgi:hypothetical protein
LEERVKVKAGIENDLIVVKDEKGNEESVKKQLRNVKTAKFVINFSTIAKIRRFFNIHVKSCKR